MTRRLPMLGFVGALSAFSADAALAHGLGTSRSECTVEDAHVRCVFTVNLFEYPDVDADRSGTISYEELDAAIARVFALTGTHYIVRGDAAPQERLLARHSLVDDHTARLEIDHRFAVPPQRLDITSTLDQLSQPEHQHSLTVFKGRDRDGATLSAAHRTASFDFAGGVWSMRVAFWMVAALLALGGLSLTRRKGAA